ncbi:hypothetical protein CUR40_08170 [Latilactobacillus sakei]|uniref:EcsC family protein n=1 Tax=Latilactobacillus sakei TaxID=1599 RepID=UPI0005525C11|nr:EcsC family protein [Latilactobacillus sakei]PKX63686.1 hypothetical protein CUR38_01990 [Latilactobacillus sakei]PKX67679.1 hypothetical protein CUR40_08170 [Latilactobacillus sakei]
MMVKSMGSKKNIISQDSMMQALDWTYNKTIEGIPGQKSIDELVDSYLKKYDAEKAIDKLIITQVEKATTSGFITGFGGAITLPVTIPANITSVMYVQMRMIAAIAKIRGYDLQDDQVQTFVYATLTGTTVFDIAKRTGITIANKTGASLLKKLPGTILTKINQAVGFRLVTKFGTKGAVNLWKMVPVAGAVVGATIDFGSTKGIGMLAKKTFKPDGIDIGDGNIVELDNNLF